MFKEKNMNKKIINTENNNADTNEINANEIAEMNIFQKMLCISAELQPVPKSMDVSVGKGNSYKATRERDIIDAVKPLEAKYGVFSYPAHREILESGVLEDTFISSTGETTKKSKLMLRIATTYRFINVHKPDEFIETITFAEGVDAQDKGSGKAMTYCDKYALLKAYKISTGDNDDVDGNFGNTSGTKQPYKKETPNSNYSQQNNVQQGNAEANKQAWAAFANTNSQQTNTPPAPTTAPAQAQQSWQNEQSAQPTLNNWNK